MTFDDKKSHDIHSRAFAFLTVLRCRYTYAVALNRVAENAYSDLQSGALEAEVDRMKKERLLPPAGTSPSA